jgi:hypothetical protein
VERPDTRPLCYSSADRFKRIAGVRCLGNPVSCRLLVSRWAMPPTALNVRRTEVISGCSGARAAIPSAFTKTFSFSTSQRLLGFPFGADTKPVRAGSNRSGPHDLALGSSDVVIAQEAA